MAEIMAARVTGIDLAGRADVIADIHAAGVPDAVCMAALRRSDRYGRVMTITS
jgi:hypothetical protein